MLTIFFGFYPAPLLDVTAVSVKKLVANYEATVRLAKRGACGSTATAPHRRRPRQHRK